MTSARDASLAFRALQRIRGRSTLELYAERLRSQWLGGDELRGRQLLRLKTLFAHCAERVPYYGRRFQERGLSAGEIRSFDDFSRLVPILDRDEVRRNLLQLRADNADRRLIIHRTGGASGEPLALPRDRSSVSSYWANELLTRSWWGVRAGAPQAKIWGHYHPPTSRAAGLAHAAREFLRRRILKQTFLSAYRMSPSGMARFARAVQRVRPASIYGYASALETLARFLDERSLTLDLPGSAVIISTSEPLFDERRRWMQGVFGRPVANEYGACEIGLIAFDCPANRMHVLEESVLVEAVDEEGCSLEEGVGEIVVTPLDNPSVPLLRYRLGDVGRLSGELCSCGRGGRIIEAIEGRTWSMLRGADGEVIYPQLVTQIVMGYAPEVKRFQAVQDQVDHVTVKLVTGGMTPRESLTRIEEDLAGKIGAGTRVEVEVVEGIAPEPSGKHVPVKSLIGGSKRTG